MRIFQVGNENPQFKAKPAAAQMRSYTKAISAGLSALDKELGIIIHNSSVPASPKVNTGIGSLLSENAEAAFIPFLRKQAVTTIQQEPDSMRTSFAPSPYSPISQAKNIFMIPLERLAGEDYNHLIKLTDISKKPDSEYVNYGKVQKEYDSVLRKAYKSFNENKAENVSLRSEFEDYKLKNSEELEPAAIYEILARKNNHEDWKTWPEAEKNLYDSEKYAPVLDSIKTKNKEEIDFFMFKQWLTEREIARANERNKAAGIGIIGDSPIAFTPVEEWRNKDVFFENLALGCPRDEYAKDGQRWGFSVIKPEMIFNPDGSLGKGGELMKKRYEKMFEAPQGGARIDHIIGLIDPWVYTKTEPMNDNNSGRLYSSPNHPILGKYAKHSDKEYASILEKIVFPAAAKFGLGKKDIICEDLGAITDPVRAVMKNLGLSGIAVTEFDYRGRDMSPDKIIMLGSHDNPSFIEYTNNMFTNKEGHHRWEKTGKLAEDTAAPHQNVEEYRWKIMHNKPEFMKASFAELFTSPAKRVQVFFTDFFGIGKTYNRPGTTEGCWSLRLPSGFEKIYYENLQKGLALNLPEAIATAIRHRGEAFSAKYQDVLAKLDEFTEILKR